MKVAQLVPSESRWGTSADKVGEELVAGVEGSIGDGAGEVILGKDTLGEAVDVEVLDEDEDEAAAADLVTWMMMWVQGP